MVTVYGLFCTATGEVYVGCTKGKIGKRMREHRCLLKAGRHGTKLQVAWNSHADTFQMKPLEVLAEDVSVIQKRECELKWMKHYEGLGLLLNEASISFQPPSGHAKKAAATRTANGYRPSAESNEKRRLAQLGKPKGNGAKISETKKRLGQKPTLEAAKAGGVAACKVRWGCTDDEIVCSTGSNL